MSPLSFLTNHTLSPRLTSSNNSPNNSISKTDRIIQEVFAQQQPQSPRLTTSSLISNPRKRKEQEQLLTLTAEPANKKSKKTAEALNQDSSDNCDTCQILEQHSSYSAEIKKEKEVQTNFTEEPSFDTWLEETLQDAKKNAEYPEDFDRNDPLWIELHELKTGISLIEKNPKFEDRIKNIQKLFNDGTLWLTLDQEKQKNSPANTENKPRHIQLKFKKDIYHSEGIAESNLEKVIKQYHFNAFEYINETDTIKTDSPLFHMRICKKHGELVWVSKGDRIAGKEVLDLYRIFEKVVTGFKKTKNTDTFYMYVFDDAQIHLTEKKADTIILRLTTAIGNKNAKTIYDEKLGFSKVLNCTAWKPISGIDINQNADLYAESLQYIRNIKMSDMYQFYKFRVNDSKTIGRLLKEVFETGASNITKKDKKSTDLEYFKNCNKTLHEFIFEITNPERIKLLKELAIDPKVNIDLKTSRTLLDVQNLLFFNYNKKSQENPEQQKFEKAFNVLWSTYIRYKVID